MMGRAQARPARLGSRIDDRTGGAVRKQQVNPWTWQDERGYSQAWRIDGPESVVFTAGQVPLAEDGSIVGEGDFEAQCRQVFHNLERVLAQSGATFENVVKLTAFFTDIANLPLYTRVRAEFTIGGPPASTAIEVKGLATPAFMIEVEATAVM
jgi:enamine deaminase RidA (YjgF/YER057c/UK114 family)